MSELRVVHLVPAAFGSGGTFGGGERYALELASAMAQVVPTMLLTFGPEDRQERRGPLTVRVIGAPWHVRGQRTNPISLRMLSALSWATVVHCHQTHTLASTTAAAYCRLTGRRVVTTDLGGGGWDLSAYFSTDRWYDAHLHLSAYSRRIAGHEGVPWAHVIYGGVDAERFSPAPSPSAEYVLYVGRLLPHKGVDVLIEALPDGLRLLVVGVEGDEAYVCDLRRLAEGKRVTFRRDVSDDELVGLYQHALCVVLPSVYRTRYGTETRVPELLGQTLLEGMACGRPAVATDVASLPEVVRHGETGLVVPPNDAGAIADALRWCREHPEGATDMGIAARHDMIERFTWASVVDRCLEMYRT